MISNPVPDPKISHSSAGSDSKNPDPEQHWRAAQKGGPAGCTTGWASELHIKLGCGKWRPAGCTLSWAAEKGGPEGCPFLQLAPPFSAARRTAFLCSTLARPYILCAAARQPAERSRFPFGSTALQPAGPPISVIPA